MLRAQRLDEHARIIEHAEAGRAPPPGMVQAADRLEAAPRFAGHDAARALERRADHVSGDVVAAGERWCVAVIQIAASLSRSGDDVIHITAGMEALDRLPGCSRRLGEHRFAIELACAGGAPECALPVY
jgi:hypothetical protein